MQPLAAFPLRQVPVVLAPGCQPLTGGLELRARGTPHDAGHAVPIWHPGKLESQKGDAPLHARVKTTTPHPTPHARVDSRNCPPENPAHRLPSTASHRLVVPVYLRAPVCLVAFLDCLPWECNSLGPICPRNVRLSGAALMPQCWPAGSQHTLLPSRGQPHWQRPTGTESRIDTEPTLWAVRSTGWFGCTTNDCRDNCSTHDETRLRRIIGLSA